MGMGAGTRRHGMARHGSSRLPPGSTGGGPAALHTPCGPASPQRCRSAGPGRDACAAAGSGTERLDPAGERRARGALPALHIGLGAVRGAPVPGLGWRVRGLLLLQFG